MLDNRFFPFFDFVIKSAGSVFEKLDSIFPFEDVPLSLFWILIGGIVTLQCFELVKYFLNLSSEDSEQISLDTDFLDDSFDFDESELYDDD